MALSRYSPSTPVSRAGSTNWFPPGVTLFFATQRIIAELYQVKDLTEIRKIEKEDPVIGQATEDGMLLRFSMEYFPSLS